MAQAPDRRADGLEPPDGKRLDSWKEIAAYLKRDVATARRWEKREGLPVRRHHHEKLGSVYAYPAELDAWLEGRQQEHRRGWQLGGRPALWPTTLAILVVTIAGLGYWLQESRRAGSGQPSVRVAVHRPGTVAGLIADGLLDVLKSRLSGVEIIPVEEPGQVGTLRALDSGDVDFGLAFNLLAFHAVKTEQLLGHRSNGITALTVAYPNPAQIVVRSDSDVTTIADLKGKRVSLGIAESAERFSSRILLSHVGLDPDDVLDQRLDFAPSLANLREGHLDAYITWRGVPAPDFTEAFASRTLRLIAVDAVSVEGLRLKHPFLIPWIIPAHVYPHQESPIPTVSARILLLASRTLSADLAEKVMRAISIHIPDLIARHPAAAEINVKKKPTFEDGLSIDLHPGAERFFESMAIR